MELTNSESRLVSMAAKLLSIAIRTAQAGSDPAEVARAAALHDSERLYPRLTITAPHGGGAVRLEVLLLDPATDEPVARLLEIEAEGNLLQ